MAFKLFGRMGGGAPEAMVVGLGNPGKKYTRTRHNAGFMALEYLAQKQGGSLKRIKFRGLTDTVSIAGVQTLLLMPQTYMNLSGESVGEAARFYRISPERIIVLYDDKDIPLGHLRVRDHGSAGGHNGIKSLISHLGTETFPRIRIGIGSNRQVPSEELIDFVIGEFSKQEQDVLFKTFDAVCDGIALILKDDIRAAQSALNGLDLS